MAVNRAIMPSKVYLAYSPVTGLYLVVYLQILLLNMIVGIVLSRKLPVMHRNLLHNSAMKRGLISCAILPAGPFKWVKAHLHLSLFKDSLSISIDPVRKRADQIMLHFLGGCSDEIFTDEHRVREPGSRLDRRKGCSMINQPKIVHLLDDISLGGVTKSLELFQNAALCRHYDFAIEEVYPDWSLSRQSLMRRQSLCISP